jgi:hypothetical protein
MSQCDIGLAGSKKKATGIDGLARVVSIAQTTKEKLGTITTMTG